MRRLAGLSTSRRQNALEWSYRRQDPKVGRMSDFGAPVKERVLAGSGLHVQLNEHVRGWRWLPGASVESMRARGMYATGWWPWTGSPDSFAKLSFSQRPERWCVLVGELPSPESRVVVTTENGDQIPADPMEGRLWTCEWPAPPLHATISVDGGTAVAVGFFQRVPRSTQYNTTDQPQGLSTTPGKVLQGWYQQVPKKLD